jgi:Uncharacterized protein conserved in bacteria
MGRYTYGLRSGKWQYWDENGALRKVLYWREGREAGKFWIYNEKGELQQQRYLRSEMESWLVRTWDWVRGLF